MERVVEVPVVHEVTRYCAVDADTRTDDLIPVPPPSATVAAGYLCYRPDDALNLYDNIKTILTRLRDVRTQCLAQPPGVGPGVGSP